MQKKKYDKKELIGVLTQLQSHLSEHTGEFPGLAPAVVALAAAAKDPMTAAAAIDRLVHHSIILELNLPSYRLERSKEKTG